MSDQLIYTRIDDPLAKPLFDGLEYEYDRRYADARARFGTGDTSARDELERYPPEVFTPPAGNFLLLLRDGQAIGGGAFMPHRDRDRDTAEFKRIWTRADLRRQGIAARVLDELEAQASRQGYRRVYLTTGFRQHEAVRLYLKHGYRPLFDLRADPESIVHLAFEKALMPDPSLPPATPASSSGTFARTLTP